MGITLTEEQQSIVNSDEHIVISALAGSGKTFSLYHYVKTRPQDSKILYLAFNKSVQEEAERKFADINHVFLHIRTAHSLAYEKIVRKYGYKVGDLHPDKVIELSGIDDYVLANHVVKLVNLFCMSEVGKVQELDYLSTVGNDTAKKYVNENYDKIYLLARRILGKMDKGEIPITHDFYLKKWQLSNPKLYYDYIAFDEGQDASEVMLSIFNKQSGTKVIVGDSHQQIYGWRNAVNSLDKAKGKKLQLTQSFRFTQKIADLAIAVIKWKNDILFDKSVKNFHMIGSGGVGEIKTKATISRGNVRLIMNAIDDVVINRTIKKPYFEGGFKGYSINSMYGIVNDIHAIKDGRYSKIKTPSLKDITTISRLKEFVDETEDILLEQGMKLVDKYGKSLLTYVNRLKDVVVEDKNDSDMIYTTAHKSKGMEYDYVIITDDFKDKSYFKTILMNSKKGGAYDLTKKYVNEEINLLYVAITRSRGEISLPISISEDL